ncbi:MAG: bifunctional adenosylcobinamide kinase/adenosylcobinamide-phosphate guanylyltransferase [Acidimicrobiia bacterium]
MIVLVLGGTRSGKSAIAERLAMRAPQPVTYIATGSAVDADMDDRIARHRDRRPQHWSTIEAGPALVAALRSTNGTVLVDALGTWLAAHHDFAVDLDELLAAITGHDGDVIIVSDEVGLGVHPSTPLGRAFRDALGEVNTAVADIADRAMLVVAGRVVELERFDIEQWLGDER